MEQTRSHARQMFGSLLVALAIVVATILLVTAKLGPTSAAELEARQERLEQRHEAREERREDRLERREDRLERREERRKGAVPAGSRAPRFA